MKKMFFFKVFILFYTLNFVGQNYKYKFTYLATIQLQKNNFQKVSEEMFLFVNENKSLFVSPTKIILDSIKKEYLNKGYSPQDFINVSKSFPKNNITSIIQKKDGKITYQNQIGSEIIEYIQMFPSFNWEIKNKSKMILGYKCYLATCYYAGRNYKAWFSKDISIQEGPYKFSGLPGLIFKINDEKKHYVFTLKSIEKEMKAFPELKKGNKVLKVKHKEFEETVDKILFSYTNLVTNPDTKRRMKMKIKRAKENSNPIELKIE